MLRAGTYVIGMPCPIASLRAILRNVKSAVRAEPPMARRSTFTMRCSIGALQSSLSRGTFQLAAMPLAVIDAQRIRGEAIAPSDRQRGGAIEPAAE